MNQDELRDIFDRQAASYDQQWEKLSPVRDALFMLMEVLLAPLPAAAHLLCVGTGTGAELAHFAARFPRWTFTAVEPSAAMIELCQERAECEGFGARCHFHHGYLETLPEGNTHHAAMCLLVSQFILDRTQRVDFFGQIARRLRPKGVLASSDLATGTDPAGYDTLLYAWMSLMTGSAPSQESLARARHAYTESVAVLPPADIAQVIASAGFEPPVQFFQAGMLHAFLSTRT